MLELLPLLQLVFETLTGLEPGRQILSSLQTGMKDQPQSAAQQRTKIQPAQ